MSIFGTKREQVQKVSCLKLIEVMIIATIKKAKTSMAGVSD